MVEEDPAAMSDTAETDTRRLAPGQRCEVWVAEVAAGRLERVHETGEALFEAPNWTLDGKALVLNGHGLLHRLDLASGDLETLALSGLPALNNDHVLHPDGTTVLVSAHDGHVYRAPLAGGPALPVTDDPATAQYLHGISPDGGTVAYIEIDRATPGPGVVALAPAEGPGPVRRLDTGPGHCDGAEFTPDGEWLVLNTEAFTDAPGHAQLARIRPDGGGFARLRTSAEVDWFPHPSPDGGLATLLSFPAGTLGHPEDLDVRIRVVRTADWDSPVLDVELFGGQGSINVPSWSPEGTHFAFVAYPDRPGRVPVVGGA
jgi:TolB protein